MNKKVKKEEIEKVVSEFCSTLEGHRRALKEIAEHYIEKGGQTEREKILNLITNRGLRAFLEECEVELDNKCFRQALKGGKDAHIIT